MDVLGEIPHYADCSRCKQSKWWRVYLYLYNRTINNRQKTLQFQFIDQMSMIQIIEKLQILSGNLDFFFRIKYT